MGIFNKAKKKSKKTTAKKTEHLRVSVDEDQMEEVFDSISEIEKIEKELKSKKTKLDMLKSNLKEIAKEKFSELYNENKKYPGTFIIESKNDENEIAQFMFSPTDKYIKLGTDEEIDELKEKYGEDIIDEETTYLFDNKMLEKYMDVFEEFIEKNENIDDNDREKIIKAKVSVKIKKGTIEDFYNLSKEKGIDLTEIVEEINPIFAQKKFEVIK